jgi:hypothetical protein
MNIHMRVPTDHKTNNNWMKYFFLSIALIIHLQVCAKNYFVAQNGSDENKGTSKAMPWKSIAKVNQQKLQAGDSVFFNRGDRFFGELVLAYSGNEKKSIIYTAYGNGDNPVFTGSKQVAGFEPYRNTLLKASFTDQVFQLYANNVLLTCARFPNAGFLRIDAGLSSNTSFYDVLPNHTKDYWKGATIHYRIFDWEYRIAKVLDYKQNILTVSDTATNNFSDGWGYYLSNKFEELDTLNEWFYQANEKALYLYNSYDGQKVNDIEAVVLENAVRIQNSVSYVEINGLSIDKYASNGIICDGLNKNILFRENIISNIGHTAIGLDYYSEKCIIENNQITDILGRGIKALEPEDLCVQHNRLKNIGLVSGLGVSGVNGMMAISVVNIEEVKSPTKHIAQNNEVLFNSIENVGYVGIRVDGTNSRVEGNYLNNVMLNLSDGSAIYSWAKSLHYSYNNIIKNNIITNVIGNNIGTPHEKNPVANGIYIDNNLYNIRVLNNTVANVSASGIHVNSDSFENLIVDNTVYNAGIAFSVAEWANPGTTINNKAEGNIFFSKEQSQRNVSLMNWCSPSIKPLCTFRNNLYCHFFEKYSLVESYLSADKETKTKNEYTYNQWINVLGIDTGSTALEHNHSLAKQFRQSVIICNPTENEMITSPDKEYVDLLGRRVEEIRIKPYSSQILLFR